MLTKEEVKQFLKEIEPYVKTSALFAANFFAQNHIVHTFWDKKSFMELTPGLCEGIYRDMLENALLKGEIFAFKYGLTVHVYQTADPESHCGVQLGVGFPFIERKKSSDNII